MTMTAKTTFMTVTLSTINKFSYIYLYFLRVVGVRDLFGIGATIRIPQEVEGSPVRRIF